MAGWVYVLKDHSKDDIYKIGVTRGDIDCRIRKLQTGNSGEIYLYKKYWTEYPFYLEKKLHLYYSGKKVMNEWFTLSMPDIDEFYDRCKFEESIIESLRDNPFFMKDLK